MLPCGVLRSLEATTLRTRSDEYKVRERGVSTGCVLQPVADVALGCLWLLQARLMSELQERVLPKFVDGTFRYDGFWLHAVNARGVTMLLSCACHQRHHRLRPPHRRRRGCPGACEVQRLGRKGAAVVGVNVGQSGLWLGTAIVMQRQHNNKQRCRLVASCKQLRVQRPTCPHRRASIHLYIALRYTAVPWRASQVPQSSTSASTNLPSMRCAALRRGVLPSTRLGSMEGGLPSGVAAAPWPSAPVWLRRLP